MNTVRSIARWLTAGAVSSRNHDRDEAKITTSLTSPAALGPPEARPPPTPTTTAPALPAGYPIYNVIPVYNTQVVIPAGSSQPNLSIGLDEVSNNIVQLPPGVPPVVPPKISVAFAPPSDTRSAHIIPGSVQPSSRLQHPDLPHQDPSDAQKYNSYTTDGTTAPLQQDNSHGDIRRATTAGEDPMDTYLEEDSDPYYPQGIVRKVAVQPAAGEFNTGWVWRNNGHVACARATTGQASRVKCVGVLQCSSCGRFTRPRTKETPRAAQDGAVCGFCREGVVNLIPCEPLVFALRYTELHEGVEREVWEQTGVHEHPRPPGGRLTENQQLRADYQVERRPEASAHALRTGDQFPGSESLRKIAGKLSGTGESNYIRRKSQQRLGIKSHKDSKGFLTSLSAIGDIKHNPDCAPVDIALGIDPTYVQIQTPWMKAMLCEYVQDCIADDHAEDMNVDFGYGFDDANTQMHQVKANFGMVTDGDRTFLLQGDLIATCVFNRKTKSYVTVLWTVILDLSAKSHRPHFRRLFRDVREAAGSDFKLRYLLNVLDFSGAERSAFIDEFVEIALEVQEAEVYVALRPEQREAMRETDIIFFRIEAEKFLVGCTVHFRRSAIRVSRDGNLVLVDLRDLFWQLINTLLAGDTSVDVYNKTMARLRHEFPAITSWIDWWARLSVARMIFPAVMPMSEGDRRAAHSTTNPVEGQHSLLHHALGVKHELIPGMIRLCIHAHEREDSYKAILGGHLEPKEQRRPPRQPHKKYVPGDGRAPDTLDLLTAVTSRPMEAPALRFSGYAWISPNSCFTDSVMELLYRAFLRLTPQARDELVTHVGRDCGALALAQGSPHRYVPLARLLWHFMRRSDPNMKGDKLDDEIRNGQFLFREAATERWLLGVDGRHDNAQLVLPHLIADSGHPVYPGRVPDREVDRSLRAMGPAFSPWLAVSDG